MKTLCIYHANCADGFAAAWVVRQALGHENVEFYAAEYNTPPPEVRRRKVVIVDFSYSREIIESMCVDASTLVLLDHHKTAIENLGLLALEQALQRIILREDRSGVGLAWDYYFPGQSMPPVLAAVEDRDLWRFRLPNTREISTGLASFNRSFEVWDSLILDPGMQYFLQNDGRAILRQQEQQIDSLLKTRQRVSCHGYDVPAVNAPAFLSSEVGNRLAVGQPFAITYSFEGEFCKISLRSVREHGVDVSAIAKVFGGGGHKHAASFKLSANSDLLTSAFYWGSFAKKTLGHDRS
jgi:oligoribonuclease NrnB/cAMP/cGMP phosphodiesterase (DHH superfamily)